MPRVSIEDLVEKVQAAIERPDEVFAEFKITPEAVAGLIVLLIAVFGWEFPDKELAKIIGKRVKEIARARAA